MLEATSHPGRLLDAATLPELPPDEARPELRRMPTATRLGAATDINQRRGAASMGQVIASLQAVQPGGRNDRLNAAAFTLGHWIAAGVLEQGAVEDALYAAAEANGLVADDGQRQTWATIRSGLSKGLQQPVDLDAPNRSRRRRRTTR